jgi:hypothetical protein
MFGKIIVFCIFSLNLNYYPYFSQKESPNYENSPPNFFWLGKGVNQLFYAKISPNHDIYFYKGNKGKIYLHNIRINNIKTCDIFLQSFVIDHLY